MVDGDRGANHAERIHAQAYALKTSADHLLWRSDQEPPNSVRARSLKEQAYDQRAQADKLQRDAAKRADAPAAPADRSSSQREESLLQERNEDAPRRQESASRSLRLMRFADSGELVTLHLPASVVPGEADRYAESEGKRSWRSAEPRKITPNVAFRDEVPIGTVMGVEEQPGQWQYFVVDHQNSSAARVGEEVDVFVRLPTQEEFQKIKYRRGKFVNLAEMPQLHPSTQRLFELRTEERMYPDHPLVEQNLRPGASRTTRLSQYR